MSQGTFRGTIRAVTGYTVRPVAGELQVIYYDLMVTTQNGRNVFLLEPRHYHELDPGPGFPGNAGAFGLADLGRPVKGSFVTWGDRNLDVVTSLRLDQ